MSKQLILHVDGGARGNPGPAAAGVVLQDGAGAALLEAGYLLGVLTNNQAEYNALLMGVQAATRLKARILTIYADSELMVRQVNGDYKVRSPELKPLFDDVHRQLRAVDTWELHHIPREANRRADALVNRALDLDEDVVEVDAGQSTPRLTRREPAEPVPRAPVRIEVVRRGPQEPCSPGCAQGSRYVIGLTLPAGLSIDVVVPLIEAIQAVRASAEPTTRSVSCAGCGAVHQVSLAEQVA